MILCLGIGLWLMTVWIAARLAWVFIFPRDFGRIRRFFTLLFLLTASFLLVARPHEDIFGGEDPGAYINSGVTYGRSGKFFHVDPMLASVDDALRPLFYFGHSGYGPTKDACLWVCNQQYALVGPHFQPGYPLMIAAATILSGDPRAALFVVPIVTVFAALALGALAGLLLPGFRWAGLSAFALFFLNPLTMWHGRAPRPEIIAAFMLFAGLTLLINGLFSSGRRRVDVWLGGCSLLAASFFHVTAWFAVLPVLAILLVILGAGLRRVLPVFLLTALALTALDLQSRYVTDYYQLGWMMRRTLGNPWMLAGLIFIAGGLLLGGWFFRRAVNAHSMPGGWMPPFRCMSTVSGGASIYNYAAGAAWVIGLAGAALFVYFWFYRPADGSLPLLGRPIEHFLYITDFKALTNMVSLPIAMMGLAGWLFWCLRMPADDIRPEDDSGYFRLLRPALAALLLPAVCLSGLINDFMMTRYLMVAIVPMLALCLTALAMACSRVLITVFRRIRGNRGVMLPLLVIARTLPVVLIIAVGLRGRTHLVTLTEYRGFARFLDGFAEIARNSKGALVVEYSRLAAPFDHFFSLPVLGIDNERRDSYEQIESEIDRLMRAFPDVPVFFITPFHAPLSDRFVFSKVGGGNWHYRRLRQAGRHLPVEIRDNVMELAMFKVSLADFNESPVWNWPQPYVVQFDSGNMGFRHFANLRSGNWRIQTAVVTRDTIAADAFSVGFGSVAELLLVGAPHISTPASGMTPFFLNKAWEGRRVNMTESVDITEIFSGCDVLSVALAFDQDGNMIGNLLEGLPSSLKSFSEMPSMIARWTRSSAELLLPVPPSDTGRLLLLARGNPSGESAGTRLILRYSGRQLLDYRFADNEWHWVSAPFYQEAGCSEWGWVALESEPAWNSGARGFPSDLGVLLGVAAVLP